MLQRSPRTAGLIEPCLPVPAKARQSGPDWLHEIKHAGFRIMALCDAAGVRLYTRNRNDFTRFPLIVAAVNNTEAKPAQAIPCGMPTNMNDTAPGAIRLEIEALLKRLSDAWARGDGKAYGNLFCDDAQYVEAPGRRVRGRAAIAQSHQRIFDSFFKGTRVATPAPPVIRQIAADVVLVESSGTVIFAGEDETSVPPNGLMTMVIKRHAEGWCIVSFQNTPTGRLRSLRFITRYLASRLRRGR